MDILIFSFFSETSDFGWNAGFVSTAASIKITVLLYE